MTEHKQEASPRVEAMERSRRGCLLPRELPNKGNNNGNIELHKEGINNNGNIDFFPLHNVYMIDYDSPVYKIALYLLQGNNRISMYIRRILAIPLVKSVVDTGEYLRENHEFRV